MQIYIALQQCQGAQDNDYETRKKSLNGRFFCPDTV